MLSQLKALRARWAGQRLQLDLTEGSTPPPEYARPSEASHATTGFKIGYRKRLQEVMLSLPDQRGTLSQIWTEFERLPQVLVAFFPRRTRVEKCFRFFTA